MKALMNTIRITLVQEHILRTLLYYDIFNYPLRASEVFQFLGTNHIAEEIVLTNLNELSHCGLVYRFGDFYSVQNNEANIHRRVKGNLEAQRYLGLAEKQAKRIARFPFVRAVMASGSLSKNYMDEHSDLDFFIVTEPGRLWIARTLLVMYKRLFLFNSHKHFCVNYFVDADHLEIEEKNLFTATELATVIPLYNAESYRQLHVVNSWLYGYFPNYTPRGVSAVRDAKHPVLKKWMEKCIQPLGDLIETLCMRLTLKRWKRMYARDYSEADFKIAFKTKKYASKNHPKHYQRRVMDLYDDKLRTFGNNHDIVWRS